MKPFLILETGVPIEPLRRHGSFGHWIRVAAGLHARQVRHVRVLDGEDVLAMTVDARARAGPRLLRRAQPRSAERRSGKDRRQIDNGPPTNYERRRAIEARQPELIEVHMSEDEIRALGFVFEQATASVSG